MAPKTPLRVRESPKARREASPSRTKLWQQAANFQFLWNSSVASPLSSSDEGYAPPPAPDHATAPSRSCPGKLHLPRPSRLAAKTNTARCAPCQSIRDTGQDARPQKSPADKVSPPSAAASPNEPQICVLRKRRQKPLRAR